MTITWLAKAQIPFDYAISKNRSVRSGNGHMYTPKAHKDLRDALVLLLRSELRGVSLIPGRKVWLNIFVEKPNNRGDAVNSLDFICDSVKIACGIDDRWYSVAGLDWTIRKDNPQLYVSIGQEATG